MSRENILAEIDKYKVSRKNVRSAVPLVTIMVIISVFFFSSANNLMITLGGIIAVCLYAGSFVLAYYQCNSKIKKLSEKL